MAVDNGDPKLPFGRVGDRFEAQPTKIRELGEELRLPVGGGGPDVSGRHVQDLRLPLTRQHQNALPLQRFRKLHARLDRVVFLRRLPVEILAQGPPQLVAAVVEKQRLDLLNVRHLSQDQAATERVVDPRSAIRGSMGDSPRCSRTANKSPWAFYCSVEEGVRGPKHPSGQQVTGTRTNRLRTDTPIRMPLQILWPSETDSASSVSTLSMDSILRPSESRSAARKWAHGRDEVQSGHPDGLPLHPASRRLSCRQKHLP